MVGLTVIAWGTSMPEVVVSGLAAWDGSPAMSLGNVLGSNVANIGLVLGVCALILPAVLDQPLSGREAMWVFGALGALWWTCQDGTVTRADAAGLLAVFLVYNVVLWRAAKDSVAAEGAEHGSRHPGRDVVLGSIAIAGGAKLVMMGAVAIAERFGVSDAVIGLTILALGTSLPELAAGIGSALKKHHDISVGNVVGSNVFNCLAVIGIAGMVRPFDGTDPDLPREMGAALGRDFSVNLAFSAALVGLPLLVRGRALRLKAFLLIAGYAVYVGWLFVSQDG
jgi:cation:H+ antiporter